MKTELALPPRLAESLLEITREPEPDMALINLMHEFIELKLESINEKMKKYERKWNMNFKKFKKACKENKLKKDTYSYEVEKDYREWEALVTLKEYYERLRERCFT